LAPREDRHGGCIGQCEFADPTCGTQSHGIDRQRYGINVFKVHEVIQCPPLTNLPKSHPIVRGIANIRGRTIPVIDLAKAIGKPGDTDIENSFVIVTEYNTKVQGYLVSGVDRIVNMKWEDVLPPPKGMGDACYLTAVTRVDNQFVEIIDVEKVLEEILQTTSNVNDGIVAAARAHGQQRVIVLVADDSSVARNQIKRPLEQLGVEHVMVSDGKQALAQLKEWASKEPEKLAQVSLVISDIEMPEMDGYTLTAEIRKDPQLEHLFVLLHSSLSGVFNKAMVEKVGADFFIPKYDPDHLAQVVVEQLEKSQ